MFLSTIYVCLMPVYSMLCLEFHYIAMYLFPKEDINKPDMCHHILEDFHTDWCVD